MIIDRERRPEASEKSSDPSLQRDLLPAVQLSGEDWTRETRRDGMDPSRREHRRGQPKRATGIQPAVRATSTDDDRLTYPAPSQDDPSDDTPGEMENPQYDFEDEDFIEDAIDEF